MKNQKGITLVRTIVIIIAILIIAGIGIAAQEEIEDGINSIISADSRGFK